MSANAPASAPPTAAADSTSALVGERPMSSMRSRRRLSRLMTGFPGGAMTRYGPSTPMPLFARSSGRDATNQNDAAAVAISALEVARRSDTLAMTGERVVTSIKKPVLVLAATAITAVIGINYFR